MDEIHLRQLSDPSPYLTYAVGADLAHRREMATEYRLRRRLLRRRRG